MWRACAGVLNTRTHTHGETHIEEAAFGRLHKGGRPPSAAAPLCGFLYGGWGGGKHSKNIQTYEQICIDSVFSCLYLPYPFIVPIILIILASVQGLIEGVEKTNSSIDGFVTQG